MLRVQYAPCSCLALVRGRLGLILYPWEQQQFLDYSAGGILFSPLSWQKGEESSLSRPDVCTDVLWGAYMQLCCSEHSRCLCGREADWAASPGPSTCGLTDFVKAPHKPLCTWPWTFQQLYMCTIQKASTDLSWMWTESKQTLIWFCIKSCFNNVL